MTGATAFGAAGFIRSWGGPRTVEPDLPLEAALSRAAVRGERAAFARLVDLHKRAVYGLCVRLLRDEEEARDAAQETFVRAYSALPTYDASQPFAPWLFRIARNHATDLLRRRLAAPRRVELDGPAGDEGSRLELADPAAARADEELERVETASSLERAVAALPDRYRQVIHLFHVEHMSYKDMAATLEVPIGTVMTWLHRARARLRQVLSEAEPS